MAVAFIGLGANLGEPATQLRAALRQLAEHRDIALCAQSPFYRSAAVGPGEQPDYCNAVAAVATALEPTELLQQLLAIERALGRIRTGERWLPRYLDLDLLMLGSHRAQTAGLQLPHPQIASREFVLQPWADIAPDTQVPGLGSVSQLLARRQVPALRRW